MNPVVCMITDRRRLGEGAEAALIRRVASAARAGIHLIQIRERDMPDGALLRLVTQAVDAVHGTRTRILVNDRADVAVSAQADGVHLRSDSAPIDRVRTLAPNGWIIGQSVHTASEAQTAGAAGADYVLFGTVFGGGTKGDAIRLAGLDALIDAVRASRAPVIAIGGIDADRAASCVAAGAAGVAAISIFLPEGRAPLAMGVTRAVQTLRQAMR